MAVCITKAFISAASHARARAKGHVFSLLKIDCWGGPLKTTCILFLAEPVTACISRVRRSTVRERRQAGSRIISRFRRLLSNSPMFRIHPIMCCVNPPQPESCHWLEKSMANLFYHPFAVVVGAHVTLKVLRSGSGGGTEDVVDFLNVRRAIASSQRIILWPAHNGVVVAQPGI